MVLRIDKRIPDMLPKGVFSIALQLPGAEVRAPRSILADLGIPDAVLDYIGLKPASTPATPSARWRAPASSFPPLATYADKL